MSDEPPASGRPAPVVLRVKLRYTTVEQFVDRFAANVGRSGIFLASKTTRALGTEIRFELRLADDTPVVVGVGSVRASRVEQAGPPKLPGGLIVAFTRVTPDSRAVLRRMLEIRRARGFADDADGLPRLDSAGPGGAARASTSGGVDASDEATPAPAPPPVPAVEPLPPSRRATSPTGRQAPRRSRTRTSEPPPIVAPSVDEARGSRRPRTRPPTLTPRAPLSASPVSPPLASPPQLIARAGALGDLISTPADVDAPAAPVDRGRRARPRRSLEELMAAAQGAAVAIVDDFAGADVDISAVVARARAMAGTDLDAELRRMDGEVASTAIVEAIDATDDVSQRLARVIGGAAVPTRPRRPPRARRSSAPPMAAPAPPPPPVVAAAAASEPEASDPFPLISTVVTAVPPPPSYVGPPIPDDGPLSTDVTDDLDVSIDVAPLPDEADEPDDSHLTIDAVTAPRPRITAAPPIVIPTDLPPSPFLGSEALAGHVEDLAAGMPPTVSLPADLLADLVPSERQRYDRAQTSVSDDIGIDIAFEAAFDPSLPSRRDADSDAVDVDLNMDDDGDDTARPRRSAAIPLPPLPVDDAPGVADVLLASDDDFYISAAALTGAEPPETGLQVMPVSRDFATEEETSTGVVPLPTPGQSLGRIKLARGKTPTPALRRTPARGDRAARPPRAMTPPPGLDDALDSLDVEINTIEDPLPVPRRPLAAAARPTGADPLDVLDDLAVDLDDLDA